jgi:Leucine-rich repeat (LRR) protein
MLTRVPFFQVALLCVLAGCEGIFGPPTFRDVVDGKIAMQSGDRQAVAALLEAAGLTPEQFLVRDTEDGILPTNGVALKGDRVVRIVLSSTRLERSASFASLTELREVRAAHNQLTNVRGFAGLAHLTSLHVENNRITTLDGLAPCASLGSLFAAANQLTSLETIGQIPSLHEIDVHENQIESLRGLSELPRLTWVNASHNRVTDAATLGVPPTLAILFVDDNRLVSIDHLLTIPTLRDVYAQRNQITRVPAEARRFRTLALTGNGATAPDATPAPVLVRAAALSREEINNFSMASCTQVVQMPCRNHLTTVSCRLHLDQLQGIVCAQFVADRTLHRSGSALRQPILRPNVSIPLSGHIALSAISGEARVYFQPLLSVEANHLTSASTPVTRANVFSLLLGQTRGLIIQSATPSAGGIDIEYSD